MHLDFYVAGKHIKEKQRHSHINGVADNVFCNFIFQSQEWENIEKFAIFWNRKGKSIVKSLGSGLECQCPLPDLVSNDLYFHIQIYANETVFTRKTKVYVTFRAKKQCDEPEEELKSFAEQIDDKIDNIIYENNKLLIYKNNKLVKTIKIVDGGLIAQIFAGDVPGFVVDTVLSENSAHAIANKAVYQALEEKIDKNSLSNIAFSGDFNDLINIPLEFPPEAHTHPHNDIVDLDIPISKEISDALNILEENL